MADTSELIVDIDTLLQEVEWLREYKSVADEVLSAINEMEFTDPVMLHVRELALRALNIGAQK